MLDSNAEVAAWQRFEQVLGRAGMLTCSNASTMARGRYRRWFVRDVEYVCPKCGAPDSVVACDNPECPGTSVPKSSAGSSDKSERLTLPEARRQVAKMALEAAGIHAERLAAIIALAKQQRDEPRWYGDGYNVQEVDQLAALHNLILGDGNSSSKAEEEVKELRQLCKDTADFLKALREEVFHNRATLAGRYQRDGAELLERLQRVRDE